MTGQSRHSCHDRGWTDAGNLEPGDRLRSADGNWVELESVSAPGESIPGYNVMVGDYHTYFVGSPYWGFSVWSHNNDPSAGKIAPQSTVRVYRVEGVPNSHVAIGEGGVVAIKQGDQTVFFNFGSKARAEQYLAQKLDPTQKLGPLPGTTVKSFDVPKSFLDEIRAASVPEHLGKKFPNAPNSGRCYKSP